MRSTVELQTRSPSAAMAFPSRRHLLKLSLAALFGATLLTVAAPRPVLAQTATVVDVVAVAQGYRFSDLKGHRVLNAAGEDIGTLDDLIVTKDKQIYAILAVGGFLGLGAHLVAVPFDSLNISPDGRTITLANASKAQLQQMPEFKYSNVATTPAQQPAQQQPAQKPAQQQQQQAPATNTTKK